MAFAFWQSRRFLAVTTLDGIIVDWNLFAANADERIGAQEVLENHRRVCVLGDKGFLDQQRQALLRETQGVSLLTPKRRNQKEQNPRVWDTAMNRARSDQHQPKRTLELALGIQRRTPRNIADGNVVTFVFRG